jgi:hypothetical protein
MGKKAPLPPAVSDNQHGGKFDFKALRCPKCGQGPEHIHYVESRDESYEIKGAEDGALVIKAETAIGGDFSTANRFLCENKIKVRGGGRSTKLCNHEWPVPDSALEGVVWE